MIAQRKIKFLGVGIILLSLILSFVVYTSTKTTLELSKELHKDCPLPADVCPYNRSIPAESAIGFTAVALLFGSGAYLILTGKETERELTRQKDKVKKMAKTLESDDKKVYDAIVASDGFIFQSDLVNKTEFSKVKVTRILDRLEGRGLVERRRRGMSNVIILKHS